MPLRITGIKILHVYIGSDEDGGAEKITAAYKLVSDKGATVGSKETLSTGKQYNETQFQPAADTVKALKDAVRLYRRDVENMLELTAE
jgi:hypothetical protein